MLCILSFLEPIMGHTMVEPGEKCQSKGFQFLKKAILITVFANTVNTSCNCMFFQLLYKYCVAFNSSKIT